jgi:hypothetical protein
MLSFNPVYSDDKLEAATKALRQQETERTSVRATLCLSVFVANPG